jgi:hypothetical protein
MCATGKCCLCSNKSMSRKSKWKYLRRGMDGEHLRAKKERVCTFPESTLSISVCAYRTRWNFTLYLHSARRLVWSPLRASSDHCTTVGALRAQELSALTYFP